jgi:MFS family permease
MTIQTLQKIMSRDFILVLIAQFVVFSVSSLLIPTLPIYLVKAGSKEVEIGVLMGILCLSSVVLRPFIGKGLLRIPEKRFMIAGAFLLVISSVGYLVAPPFWPFLVVRIIQGVGGAFFHTASVTLIANITPEAHRGQSLSYYFMAINIAFAAIPPLGMFIINQLGFTILFLVCTGLSLGTLFIAVKLKNRAVDLLEDQSMKDQPFLHRGSLPPAIMSLMASIIFGAIIAFFPLYAINHGVANPGFFFSAFAISMILCNALGGKIPDLYRRESVIWPSLVASIIAMILLAFSKTLPMFILVAIIWGIGSAFLYPTFVAYALDLAGSSRGTAMGTFTALDILGVGIGPVIMGVGLRLTSYPIMFLCLALIGAIDLGYFYYVAKD